MKEIEETELKFSRKKTRIFLSALFLCAFFIILTLGSIAPARTPLPKHLPTTGTRLPPTFTLYSVADSLQRQSKLVIQTALVTVDQSLEKENTLSLAGYAFDLGSSNLRMISLGNKVQYYVPLKEITETDIQWDSEKKTLTVKVPPPVADTEMVEIQTDPQQILFLGESSWFDWARGGGKTELAQEAKDNLRNYVLQTARSRYYMSLAEENAQRELERLLVTILYPIEPQTRIVIEFKPRR